MARNIEELLSEFLVELRAILLETKQEARPSHSGIDEKVFFDEIRGSLFGGRLTGGQVAGIKAKLDLIRERNLPMSWAAYILATSYHETARRMLPVREGLNASDAWRRKNLRYYPWYGRGDVQLTWEANYRKADVKLNLGGKLISNPDLALDPEISAKVIVTGMVEGWFSNGNTLEKYLKKPEEDIASFTQARRIVNIMDRASLIGGYAVKFQTALKKAGY